MYCSFIMASYLVMEERFFTSTEASEITGCSRRQVQHWRKQGIIVPTVNPGGKGRNVYYSELDLLNLSVMKYLLSRGLSFEASLKLLMTLKQRKYFQTLKSWQDFSTIYLSLDPETFKPEFVFNIKHAEEELGANHLVIPVNGRYIYNVLQQQLQKFHNT